MKIRRGFLLGILSLGAVLGGINIFQGSQNPPEAVSQHVQAEEPDRVLNVPINTGDTFGIIAESAGLPHETITSLLEASSDVYDLTTIRAGKELLFTFDHASGFLKKVTYEPSSEEILTIAFRDAAWEATLAPIEYELKRGQRSGTIESSLYAAGLAQGLDERLIIELADIFAWQIDFGLDIRVGDSFTLIYDDRYRNGSYVMPDSVIAAKFVNDGVEYYAYRYTKADGTVGYYDRDGNSTEKELLKTPLQYRYISSGFTSARYHPVIGKTTAHYAIDFAASHGTPVVSVGNGTVLRAGWNGGYGNFIEIRHNDTYTTRYGHFSKLAVSYGEKVTQNQVIGYVGSTGWSTGPHLHYEVYKSGTPVNPLKLDLPPLEGLSEEEMPSFTEYIQQFSL